ncbi:MAG: hypothetical protein CFE21_13850 [Bacteroidetes bacterium B1(2017)]|nr:MAG: hypothetical protein CFE21_13850 [Bacteroidetes bacterium B1(2017)]
MEQKWANKLNNDEFNLITDTWYPLLKKNATLKIKAQLASLGQDLELLLPGFGSKISSGENFLNLPYMVLDYPKISGNNFPFLFRTLFWWGHAASFQVLVRTKDRPDLCEKLVEICEDQTLIYVGDNLWENNFEASEFVAIAKLSEAQKVQVLKQDMLKFVWVSGTKKPENLFEEAIGFYKKFIEVVLSA